MRFEEIWFGDRASGLGLGVFMENAQKSHGTSPLASHSELSPGFRVEGFQDSKEFPEKGLLCLAS